jgi:hypothetical protein
MKGSLPQNPPDLGEACHTVKDLADAISTESNHAFLDSLVLDLEGV